MDKAKRVLAMAGVIILVLLYLMTIISAITATDESHSWFVASVVMTVFIPCFLYAVNLVINLTKQNEANNRMREEMYMAQMRESLKKKAESEHTESENAQQ
jgi:Na+/melibiose symporter-like transporter